MSRCQKCLFSVRAADFAAGFLFVIFGYVLCEIFTLSAADKRYSVSEPFLIYATMYSQQICHIVQLSHS